MDPVTAYEHWHRYAYALQFASGKKVLDLASGEGYGSATLASTAQQVIAIEIDENAVRHARLKYRDPNLHFIVGSIMEMPLSKIQFDVIVCFEAIEHISDPEKLLHGVKRVLHPDGLFLVSTPNKPEYKKTEPSNPFHVNELDFDGFRTMLSRHFKQTRFLGQRVYCNSSLWPVGNQSPGMIWEYLLDQTEEEFFLASVDRRVPLYFVGIASDVDRLPNAPGAVLVDSSNSLLKEASRIQEETEANAQSLREALAWKEDQLQQAQIALAWKEDQLQQAQAAARSQEQALAWKEDQLQQAQIALAWKEDQLQLAHTTAHSQERALAWKEDQLQQANAALAWKEDQIQQTQATVRSQEQALTWREGQLEQAQATIAWRESQVSEYTHKIEILQTENARSAAELSAIKSGRTWKLIQKLLRTRNRLFPPGSRRRAYYDRWTGS
jgi:SAM-dependent methyltransferase